MLRSLDRALDYVGAFGRSLNAGDLIASAQKRTGLDDFGQWNFREPLEVLLHAYENESALTTFGRLAARWDMSRMLTNLLRLRREEAEHPEILRESITQPIFILGMPRSGTTFLHNLLILDPNLRIPLCWQTILPYPLSDDPDTPDRRERVVRRQLAGLPISPNYIRWPPTVRRNVSRSLARSSRACATTPPITCPRTSNGSIVPDIWKPIVFIDASCSICSIRIDRADGCSKAPTTSLPFPHWRRCIPMRASFSSIASRSACWPRWPN
jgi:hypothetical protein